MKTKDMTLEEIRTKGLEALTEKLGPAGMIKFIQMFDKGSGDYTRDRHKWLKGIGIDQIADEILTERKKSEQKAG